MFNLSLQLFTLQNGTYTEVYIILDSCCQTHNTKNTWPTSNTGSVNANGGAGMTNHGFSKKVDKLSGKTEKQTKPNQCKF